LRAPAIQALATDDGPLQLSLFDQRDLAEIISPDYPGERLIVCRNPALAEERARKRGELLAATEQNLLAIQARVRRKRRPLKGAAASGEAVGAVLNRKKMALHPNHHQREVHLRPQPGHDRSRSTARWHLCFAHPGVAAELDAEATVRSYKALSTVQCAFRSCKTIDLEVWPIFHLHGLLKRKRRLMQDPLLPPEAADAEKQQLLNEMLDAV
jgi:hypothetical protein